MQKTVLDGTAYEIPIENFERDMNTESSNDKKEKILDLFINHNQLKSEEEYDEIEFQLHYACEKGDFKLIKILLSETIEDESKNFLFKIDKTNKTASFYGSNQESQDLIIPRSIKQENDDYLITSICGLHCENALKIKFEEESSVSTIYGYAFLSSNIEEIYFPKSLIELKEGWCRDTKKLKRIIISPSNCQFIFKEDKYLIGKSNQNSVEFDKLVFARRDIKEISIPLNIQIIGSYSFHYSNIVEISIPLSVTKICEFAFYNCGDLRKVEIPTNSNLQTIGKFAFARSNIEEISIPPSVTKICEYAFSDCINLIKVEIPTNSNLQAIEKFAFSYSNIEEIYFPKSLIELKEGWCSDTQQLRRIIISPSNCQFIFKEDKYLIGKSNENNEEFDKLIFVRRDIKEISIPLNIKIIGSSSLERSNIEEISIPSSVTKICEYAFSVCDNLRKVEIPTNSNLQTIEECAFSSSNIEEISIPSSVTKICEYAFSNCSNLRKVEIPTNSNLQTIEKYAFSESKIEEISIPRSVAKICEGAFSFCSELQIIEISEESQLQSISKSYFEDCQEHMIIMIPSSLKELIHLIEF